MGKVRLWAARGFLSGRWWRRGSYGAVIVSWEQAILLSIHLTALVWGAGGAACIKRSFHHSWTPVPLGACLVTRCHLNFGTAHSF